MCKWGRNSKNSSQEEVEIAKKIASGLLYAFYVFKQQLAIAMLSALDYIGEQTASALFIDPSHPAYIAWIPWRN